jgi:peroxiredoxin
VELQEEFYPQIRAAGAELLAISTDDLDGARQMAEHAGATFPVLADADHAVASAYGVFDLLGDGVAAPAVFILAPDGTLLGGHVGQSIGDRVPAQSILDFLNGETGSPT